MPRFIAIIFFLYASCWVVSFAVFDHPARAAVADTLEALAEKSLGDPEAPVEIIEFASLTCSHCAHFHQEILPLLKRDYIDSGKLRFVYRDFPLDRYALYGSMLARCSGEKGFFPFIDVLYAQQAKWIRATDPLKSLGQIARQSGMTSEDFKVCLGNKAIEDGILENRLEAERQYKIQATPTLIINGEKYEGKKNFEAIERAIKKRLPDS